MLTTTNYIFPWTFEVIKTTHTQFKIITLRYPNVSNFKDVSFKISNFLLIANKLIKTPLLND